MFIVVCVHYAAATAIPSVYILYVDSVLVDDWLTPLPLNADSLSLSHAFPPGDGLHSVIFGDESFPINILLPIVIVLLLRILFYSTHTI